MQVYRMTSVLCDADRRRDPEELRKLFFRLSFILLVVGLFDAGQGIYHGVKPETAAVQWPWWAGLALATLACSLLGFVFSMRRETLWNEGSRREIGVLLFPFILTARYAVWLRVMVPTLESLVAGHSILALALPILTGGFVLAIYGVFIACSALFYLALRNSRQGLVAYSRLAEDGDDGLSGSIGSGQSFADPTPVRIDSL